MLGLNSPVALKLCLGAGSSPLLVHLLPLEPLDLLILGELRVVGFQEQYSRLRGRIQG